MATAEPVGKQAALYTAKTYMLAKGKNVNADQKPFKAARKATDGTTVGENAYYYVFNAGNDGGYVIVSGDDRVEPILGYVEQGYFDPDNIPDNMRSWLQQYADEIKYVIYNDIQPNSPILKRPNKTNRIRHSVPEILTTRWNQGLPYNLTLTKYYKEDGTQARPATGCTATAWAQVINFHKFPDKIKTAIPSYTKTYTLSDGTTKTVTFPAVPRNSVIDWDNMQDTYSCDEEHAHTAADTAVANLMRYCGQAVTMSYGGTSTANWRVDDVVKYFGFDDSAYRAGRNDYSIDEWFDLLYNEIAAGCPVAFSGSKISGGHAFVLDGFDGENLFHVNWGWGGGSNGWFLIGVLNSGDNSGIGAASGSGGYARGQAAVIGLRHPDNIKADPKGTLTVSEVSIDGTTIKCKYANKTGASNSFNTGIVKLEDDGTYSLVGSAQTISGMANDATQNKTFEISTKLPEGTYKLSPGSKMTTSKIWKASYNMRDQYIEAIIDAEGVPTMRIVNPVYNLSIEDINILSYRIVGQEQEIEVTFRNNGDEFYKDVYLFASKTQTKAYTENLARVAVRKGEAAKFSFYYAPDEVGTYNLWFCTDKNGGGEIGHGTMDIREDGDVVKASLTVGNVEFDNSVTINNAVYPVGKRLIGKATITNNSTEDFHGGIKLQLWKQVIGSNSASSASKYVMANHDIGVGESVTIPFEFNNLEEGIYYRIKFLYVNQEGTLANGGLWDHKWEIKDGILSWKGNGTVSGQAYRSTLMAATLTCGMYADCNDITRLSPNANANTIYAFASGMTMPSRLENSNVVIGNHSTRIKLVNDKAFYAPVTFDADTAAFVYTFPETEDGTHWHTFTMPFEADSIFVNELPVSLEDNTKHFWIYEFAAQGDNGEVVFEPAKVLRCGIPYIIAGDETMAGRSVTFRSLDVPLFKTGEDKMTVSSSSYQFRGTTLAPVIKNCYILNATGTAFEYATTNKTLTGLNAYFTTNLPEGMRLPSIVLPQVPVPVTIFGDINGDSSIDITDAVAILDIIASGETGTGPLKGDMNNDGVVDISDFVLILDLMAQ